MSNSGNTPRKGLAISRASIGLVVLLFLADSCVAAAQDDCYADCADGLAPVDDVGPGLRAPAPTFEAVLFGPGIGVVKTRFLDDLIRERPIVLAFGSYT